jgi:hypothetical protein
MTEGATANSMIPAGWRLQSFPDTFSAHAGPFYFRDYREKEPGVGFVSEPRHANAGGIVHGGRIDEGVHLLSKPYRREELARRLREVLGQA